MNLVLVTKVLESKALEMRYAIMKAYLGHLEEHNSSETNKSKSKFTPRPRDIKRFYNKYVAKQEYFAYTYNTANTAITANTALIPRLECKTFVDKTFVGKTFEGKIFAES